MVEGIRITDKLYSELFEKPFKSNCMKNTLLLASLIAAGTAAAAWIVKRRRDVKALKTSNAFVKKTHHRTDVFARAKDN